MEIITLNYIEKKLNILAKVNAGTLSTQGGRRKIIKINFEFNFCCISTMQCFSIGIHDEVSRLLKLYRFLYLPPPPPPFWSHGLLPCLLTCITAHSRTCLLLPDGEDCLFLRNMSVHPQNCLALQATVVIIHAMKTTKLSMLFFNKSKFDSGGNQEEIEFW
jgi:hypothetical protein